MNYDLSERERIILQLVMEQGAVSVTELSQTLSVSEVTIRSDLTNLEERALVNRTRGGAVAAMHPDILAKQNNSVEEKHRIAKAAAGMIEDGDTVMVEAGTTTALIVRYLFGKRDIHIVTNSTLVFASARLNPSLEITVVGGQFRRSTESLVGTIAVEDIKRFNVRTAFVGTDGFSVSHGITTHLVEGGDVIKAMKEQAQKTVLLADSSKYNKTGFVTILPLNEIDVLITDKKLNKGARAELEEHTAVTLFV